MEIANVIESVSEIEGENESEIENVSESVLYCPITSSVPTALGHLTL